MIERWPVPAMILQPDIAAIRTPVVQLLLNISFVRQTLLGQVVTSASIIPGDTIGLIGIRPVFLIYKRIQDICSSNQTGVLHRFWNRRAELVSIITRWGWVIFVQLLDGLDNGLICGSSQDDFPPLARRDCQRLQRYRLPPSWALRTCWLSDPLPGPEKQQAR